MVGWTFRKGAWLATTIFVSGAASLPARAQAPAPAGAEVEHERARKQGEAAAARRDFAACAEAYGRARALAPDSRRAALAAGEAGLCEEALDRPVIAYDLLRLAQEQEPAPAAGGGQGPWKRFAAAAERLERRVARALVIVSPADAEVFLDGVRLGSELSGRYVTVTPGEHTWVAKHALHEDVSFTHTARANDYPDVRLFLPLRELRGWPCDEACRAAIRADGERIGREKARAQLEVTLRKQVQAEIELIYRRRVDPGLSLIVGGALSAGLTLDVGPGFFLGGEARWRKFDELGFSAGLEVQALLPTKGSSSVDIAQVVIAAVPCLQYKWLSGCAFADVGLLIGGGENTVFEDDNPFLATAGFGPRLGFQLPFAERFMVRAFTELRISPVYTGFRGGVIGPGETWINPLVTGLFGLGISFGEPVRREP